jgi:hypothetical protein
MAKTKTMCKWSKSDIEKRFDKFKDLVGEPTHACANCGRVARKKKALCKSRAL